MGTSIRIEGDTNALMKKLRQLSNIDKNGLDKVLGETIKTSTRDRFRTEKAPNGKKWEPSKRAITNGGVTLVNSAVLKNSITYQSNETGFAVGTNSIYAATHQLGDKRTISANSSNGLRFKIGDQWVTKKEVKVDIPARPFLGISAEDEDEIKSTIEDFVNKA